MVNGINDLNNLQIDVLREIGNIGAGNAATALAKMLNRKVDMDVPRVKIMEFRDVSETLGSAESTWTSAWIRCEACAKASWRARSADSEKSTPTSIVYGLFCIGYSGV